MRTIHYVLIAGTPCFLNEPSATIRETLEILKDNGSLIICEIPRDSSWGKYIEERARSGHRFYKHAKLYTTEEVQDTLENLGFIVVDIKATPSFGLGEHERVEQPSDNIADRSYVCLNAVKS